MRIELADDASYEELEKSYFRDFIQRGYNITKMAEISGQSRSTIHRKFERWGWNRKWVISDPSGAPPAGTVIPPPPGSAPLPAAPNHPLTNELLEPHLLAKAAEVKARRKNQP